MNKFAILMAVISLNSGLSIHAHAQTAVGTIGTVGGVITPDNSEEARRREEVRRFEEQERRRDLASRAEAHKIVSAVGINDDDCLDQAEYRAHQKSSDIISECERKAENLFRCQVASTRILEYPTYIMDVTSTGSFDKRKSNETTCRSRAAQDAESSALSDCYNKFGVSCELTESARVTSYKVYKQRRYLLFGPKDEHHACTAIASAAPSGRYRVQCSLEVTARADYHGPIGHIGRMGR